MSRDSLSREAGACRKCGSVVRLRALVHLLSLHLFGDSLPVQSWPIKPDVVGYGVSDWPKFEQYLPAKVGYKNTQFDEAIRGTQLFLDITSPPDELEETADFVICSEVLEHVAAPVQRAFDGLFALLKPGGALIFSVPYWLNPTVEHFPELHDWQIKEIGGSRTLVNRTISGEEQTFTELCFHGGGDAVLEMRLFGFEDVLRHLNVAGFEQIAVAQQQHLPYGIDFPEPWSLPISARKPRKNNGT